jgi:hypothetical protein
MPERKKVIFSKNRTKKKSIKTIEILNMKRLIKLFEEETGYLYPKSYLEYLQWHQKYHEWLQSKLNRLLNFEEDQKKLKKFLNK